MRVVYAVASMHERLDSTSVPPSTDAEIVDLNLERHSQKIQRLFDTAHEQDSSPPVLEPIHPYLSEERLTEE